MIQPKEIHDRHINSAITGFYLMGNCDAVIAAVVGCSLDRVFNTIKLYKDIKGETLYLVNSRTPLISR